MDPMVYMMILQMQAQQNEARRQAEEAAAKKKAEDDAAAAAAAQAQRQAQVANQRQVEAAQAQQDEATRQAGLANRAAPIAPADSYSPIGGSFYGSSNPQSTAQTIGANSPQATQAFAAFGANGRQAPQSGLADMFGSAYAPRKQPAAQSSIGSQSAGSSGGSFQMF